MSTPLARNQLVLNFSKDRFVNRKKKYAPKVRSGCDVCKKRKVKCDEKRPACERCQNGGFKCVYNVPVARYFQSRPNASPETSDLVSIAPFVPLNYGNDEEFRSLGFFLRRTGPMLSMAMGAHEFWHILVAQASWKYPEVKDLMVALSLLDQNLARVNTSIGHDGFFAPALQRYNKGLALLSKGKSSITCVLIASILAWMFEVITGNYKVGLLHVKASKSIKEEYQSAINRSISLEQQLLVDAVDVIYMKAHTLGMFAQPQPTFEITTLDEARKKLLEVFDYLTAENLTSKTARLEGQDKLNCWRKAIEMFRYLDPGAMPVKRKLYLLHNMGITYIFLFCRKTSEEGISDRLWDCILNDIEHIVDFEGVAELSRGLLMLLDLIIAENSDQSQFSKRALKLKEQVWRQQKMSLNQTEVS